MHSIVNMANMTPILEGLQHLLFAIRLVYVLNIHIIITKYFFAKIL